MMFFEDFTFGRVRFVVGSVPLIDVVSVVLVRLLVVRVVVRLAGVSQRFTREDFD